MGTGGKIQLEEGTAGGTFVGFKAPDTEVTTELLWTLPSTDGTAGQLFGTDGAKNIVWVPNMDSSLQAAIDLETTTRIVSDSSLSAQISDGAMPAGAIVAFGMSTPPLGWLACDGSPVSRTTYATLFSAISTTWDSCRNQATRVNYSAPLGTEFRLPDLRGTFLRSVGTSNGYSATSLAVTQDDATAVNSLSNTASTVTGSTNIGHTHGSSSVSGTVGGTDGTHTHSYSDGTLSTVNKIIAAGVNYSIQDVAMNTGTTGSGHGHGFTLTAAGQTLGTTNVALGSGSAAAQAITGDAETRPVNVGIHYFIKT
jgi:microcystin-dependent protein